MKDVENIGILVTPNPTQPVELKGAVNYIGKKCRRLEAANIERNPYLAQLLLHDCDHETGALGGRSFHRDVEAHAIDLRIASRIEQGASLCGIVIVDGHIAVVSPTLRG